MKINENLKRARKEAGVTQKELAEKIGAYQKDISRWESGDRMPNVESLISICTALNVSADTILGIRIKK